MVRIPSVAGKRPVAARSRKGALVALIVSTLAFAAAFPQRAEAAVIAGQYGTQATAVNAIDDRPLEFEASVSRHYTYTGGAVQGGRGSASLLSGIVRAAAYAENGSYGGRIVSGASAVFWERVVFTSNDENSQLYRSFKVDGVVGGGGRAQARFYWGYTSTPVSELEKLPNFGWVEFGSGETILDEGIVPVIPGFPLYIYAELTVSAATGTAPNGHAFADFGSTGHFEWELPPGLTFTSASGGFMSEPVPEPSAFALVVVGAIAAACGRHRSWRA